MFMMRPPPLKKQWIYPELLSKTQVLGRRTESKESQLLWISENRSWAERLQCLSRHEWFIVHDLDVLRCTQYIPVSLHCIPLNSTVFRWVDTLRWVQRREKHWQRLPGVSIRRGYLLGYPHGEMETPNHGTIMGQSYYSFFLGGFFHGTIWDNRDETKWKT